MLCVFSTESLLWAAAGQRGDDPQGTDYPGDTARTAKISRIMIVEDEALVALTLEEMIEQLGYAVCGVASRGVEAIRMAQQQKPDLILMDVRLADRTSGIEAAEQILAHRAVPIIFTTAFSDRQTVEKIAELGAELLAKPVVLDSLGPLIENRLKRRQSQ